MMIRFDRVCFYVCYCERQRERKREGEIIYMNIAKSHKYRTVLYIHHNVVMNK